MRSIVTAAPFLALAVGLAACATTHRSAPSPAQPPAAETKAPISVTVDNRNWLDVVVYVVSDGMRTRLGLVTATTAHTFTIGSRLLSHVGELHFVADPVGDGHYFESEAIVVHPGQRVSWTLQSGLERSALSVR
jgi:hypothetical protein